MDYSVEKENIKRITDVKGTGMSSDAGAFLYHSLPVAVAAFRVITNEAGSELEDAECIYANEQYLQRMGIREEDFVGKRILDKVRFADRKWKEVLYRTAVKGETIRDRRYSEITEHWVEFIASPGIEKETCLLAFLPEVSKLERVDYMTELPNREFFMQLGYENSLRLLDQGLTPVVLTCDVTGMKSFNLKYGMKDGDDLLRGVASLLSKYFGRTKCSRFGEDHFYVSAPEEGLTQTLGHLFDDLKLLNEGHSLPVRVGIARYEADVPIDMICDRARMASMTVERSMESKFAFFREDMSKRNARRYYILTHLNEAMEKGWIVPYYQPVIRTLTKRLCNMEALARWNDPEYGIISPEEFIPVLEENGQSYRLDNYVVEQVAEMLQRRMEEGQPLVPVSVNLSRSDFDYCDPVADIADICDSRGIRRELINVEITETSLISNQRLIESAIQRFHKAGFEVWMDDFGSGYSSLNLLKDYEFDEIKIDMLFMRNFDEKSKKIVTMAVRMAKSLGIHTLVEGVETEEQYQFLKSIGCERIQGFYSGRPMPEDELMEYLVRQGIEFEDREMSSFYQKTGLLNLVSERPLALFFFNGDSFEPRFLNDRFEREISLAGMTSDEVIRNIMNSRTLPVGRQFRMLAEKAAESGKNEIMTFVLKNRYFHLSFTHVAESRLGHMLMARVDGTIYEEQKSVGDLNLVIRNFITVYDCIYVVDPDEDTHVVVSSDDPEEQSGGVLTGVQSLFEKLKKRQVLPSERKKYGELFDLEKILERLNSSGKGNFAEMFIMKASDGSYIWKEYLFVALPGKAGSRFMICIKPSAVEDEADKQSLIRRVLRFMDMPDELRSRGTEFECWKSLLAHSNLKLFWKDRERRFLGASQAFLDYYGFESEDAIRGRTDEEVGWHVEDVPYMLDERRVIEKRESIINVPGSNVVDGVIVRILANKFPVYHEGKITGLVGYFVDVARDLEGYSAVRRADIIDTVSGVLNAKGGIDAMLEMDNNLQTNGENYICTQLMVSGYDNVLKDYGENVAHKLIRNVAGAIRASFDDHAIIARISGCLFNIFERNGVLEKTMEEAEACVDAIEGIRDIDDRSCHLNVKVSIMTGTDQRLQRNVEAIVRARRG